MPRYEGDIIHSDARKNHKYIYRVKVDDDKYMYFYTQDELDNYMNRKSGVRRDPEIDKIYPFINRICLFFGLARNQVSHTCGNTAGKSSNKSRY